MTAPILVIDDDANIREPVTEIFGAAGFHVVAAENGNQAMVALRGGLRPSWALVDLVMPVMDGETFCRQLHRDPTWASIPVVLYSAESDIADVAVRCGAIGWLKKRASVDSLLELARRLAR